MSDYDIWREFDAAWNEAARAQISRRPSIIYPETPTAPASRWSISRLIFEIWCWLRGGPTP